VLRAIGLPELIAQSPAEYRALALRYGRDASACAALRAKLAANRRTLPLFDTARFARNLEAGYREIWRRYVRRARPASIRVVERSGAGPAAVAAVMGEAEAHRRAGDRTKAIAAYRHALALDPGYVDGQLHLANLLRGEGAAAEAADRYREAVALDPNSAEGWGGLAAMLATGGPMAKHRERCRRLAEQAARSGRS
jgi:tetratricopeptide (TPR) repeat protein